MTLDNMTGITKASCTADDTFCKSQLITCTRVKECNGVCPFEDALKHADQTQTMNEQHTVDHDRDWIIGCIQHDGFIHTHRFDKANQIILDALSAEKSNAKTQNSNQETQKSNGDLIYRADAIEAVKDAYVMDAIYKVISEDIINALKAIPSAEAVQGYTEWLEKIIVDSETFEWLCEGTTDKEWCEKNCKYDSIQAECLRHLYETSKGGDSE